MLDALRQTSAGSALVRELTGAPDLDGWAIVERLLKDLASLAERMWLVIDDVHELAAGWFAGHGFGVEAIRRAQAARDWGRAARLLADHWPGLYLGGQAVTIHELLAGFPAEARAADAELAAAAEQARRLQALAEAPDAAQPGLGEELRALALVSLGVTEFWAARLEAAQRHLEQGVALGAPDRAALSGVQRPGLSGGERDPRIACADRRA